jgi:hypothetical protein
VIYRTDYHPIYRIGDVSHVLVKSVVAVIENKASIESVARLRDALYNLASVKRLDRTNRGKNYTLRGSEIGEPVDPDQYAHQIFGAILTEHSLADKTLVNEYISFLGSHSLREWPNYYGDVHTVALRYASTETPASLTAAPEEAGYLAATDVRTGGPPPLLDLAEYLIDYLRIAPLIDFKPADYHLTTQTPITLFHLPRPSGAGTTPESASSPYR